MRLTLCYGNVGITPRGPVKSDPDLSYIEHNDGSVEYFDSPQKAERKFEEYRLDQAWTDRWKGRDHFEPGPSEPARWSFVDIMIKNRPVTHPSPIYWIEERKEFGRREWDRFMYGKKKKPCPMGGNND